MNFHTLFCFLMVASAGAQASTEPDPHSYAEPDKVTVNALAPGFFPSKMTKGFRQARTGRFGRTFAGLARCRGAYPRAGYA